MKIAKKRTPHRAKITAHHFCVDEFHLLSGVADASKNLNFGLGINAIRKISQRHMIATQAIMKFNSGKKVRFLGSTHWSDTGESIKPRPKKFIPAQVMRRAVLSSGKGRPMTIDNLDQSIRGCLVRTAEKQANSRKARTQ